MIELAQLVEQCAPNVARDTMLAIINTESAGNPYAISYEVRGRDGSRRYLERQPSSHAEAVAWATWFSANGYSYAAGLTQVYSTNFRHYGLSIENAFRPCTNIAAGAAILTDKFADALDRHNGATGPALVEALSRYNTGHPERGIANGYVRQVIRKAPAPRRRKRLAAAVLALGMMAGTAKANDEPATSFDFGYHVVDTTAAGAVRAFDDGSRTVVQFVGNFDEHGIVLRNAETNAAIAFERIGDYAVLDGIYPHIIIETDKGTTSIHRKKPARAAAIAPAREIEAAPAVPAPREAETIPLQPEPMPAPIPEPQGPASPVTTYGPAANSDEPTPYIEPNRTSVFDRIRRVRLEPIEVGAHLWSHHTVRESCSGRRGDRPNCRDFTPGVFARFDSRSDRWEPVVGAYHNSQGNPTVYAGAVYRAWEKGRFSAEIALAAATGYRKAPIVPMVMPSLRMELGGGWSGSIGALPCPQCDVGKVRVVHFTVARRF